MDRSIGGHVRVRVVLSGSGGGQDVRVANSEALIRPSFLLDKARLCNKGSPYVVCLATCHPRPRPPPTAIKGESICYARRRRIGRQSHARALLDALR